jgi:hypothetical protein|tara:strand:+ start:486 stop:755 length:270 start_codon:yes stop_codon:yes gene_type:complete
MQNQKQLFEFVWSTRDHFSEVSGKPLLPRHDYRWHWQFAHVLSKGAFPKYRLNPDNIMLMLPEEHEKQESFPVFQERHESLKLRYHTEA